MSELMSGLMSELMSEVQLNLKLLDQRRIIPLTYRRAPLIAPVADLTHRRIRPTLSVVGRSPQLEGAYGSPLSNLGWLSHLNFCSARRSVRSRRARFLFRARTSFGTV